MDSLLIAEAAEEEYTESLKWYAERSLPALEPVGQRFRCPPAAHLSVSLGLAWRFCS
ncbi:MAG: hypothetical protein KJ000_13715 [Pirellulaceae bacterium]|nr:hypothetical protein [Pirellulaceae bacterium]